MTGLCPTAEETALRLADGLSAYLCHDMAGLLGTLAATIEDGDEDAEALGVARAAVARLRYLRAAWAGRGGALDGPGFSALAGGLPGADRCRIDCTGIIGTLDEDCARIGLCLLPACVLALPRGGVIEVSGGGLDLVMAVAGAQAAWPAIFMACAADPQAAWSLMAEPRGPAVPLACVLARRLGYRVALEGGLKPTLRCGVG